MSDDLLRRLDEWGTVKRLEYLPSLGREAAAALRELEAEREIYRSAMENLARKLTAAEAELNASLNAIKIYTAAMDKAEAERDEQTTELSRLTVERAKLMNDNDALRALLREIVAAPHWLTIAPDYSPETAEFHARVKAALARGETP